MGMIFMETPAQWWKQAWSLQIMSSLVTINRKPVIFLHPHFFRKAILSHYQPCTDSYGQLVNQCLSLVFFFLIAHHNLHVNYTSHTGSGSSFITLDYTASIEFHHYRMVII